MPRLDATGFLLTIAGHDPTGGAGLTTDLAAWQAIGWKGASVCTALTVQNAQGVQQVLSTPAVVVRAALGALCVEADPVAVKVGMLGDAAVAAEVAAFCADYDAGPVVWDPVLAASAGGVPLLAAGAAVLCEMAEAATVITPNRVEAAALLGLPAWTDAGPIPAAWLEALRAAWLRGGRTQAVVLKGGHAQGPVSVDWLISRDSAQAFVVPRLAHGAHGTGCLFAASLAAMLPWGWSAVDAVVEAQWRTHAGIAQAWQLAGGRAMVNANAVLDSRSFPSRPLWPGDVPVAAVTSVASVAGPAPDRVTSPPPNPAETAGAGIAASAVAVTGHASGAARAAPPGMPRGAQDLAAGWHEPAPGAVARFPSQAASAPSMPPSRPTLPKAAPAAPAQAAANAAGASLTLPDGLEVEPVAFAALIAPPGFYPVVPDADWALRLLDWGVRTLQLRIKNLRGAPLAAAIARVSQAAAQAGAQLFINDHWREAIDAGAFGVHLGQEDLHGADVTALRAAGMRLGVSTHAPGELARAHALRPSYIALGPVYPTTLKVMPYQPLGLERLRDWAARCKPCYPTVAIGGISLQRAAAVLGCGVDGFAVVSAVTQAADPQTATREGLRLATQALQCRADFSA